jgi:copper oxidase (laccase) domain-containing protein
MWLKIPAARTKLHANSGFQQQFANLDQIHEPPVRNSVSKTPLNRETTDGTDKE